MKYILFYSIIFLLFSCGHTNNSQNNQVSVPQSNVDKFAGVWSSVTDNKEGNPNSIYIEKSGDIYNLYFIASNGNNTNHKGILDNNTIKVGKDYTLKYLDKNQEIYLVENGMEFRKMKSVEETINEIKKEIKDNNGGNLYTFIYIPFTDDYANSYNKTPNFTLTQQSNIGKGVDDLFDKTVKDAFLSPKLISHYDLQKNGSTDLSGNWLLPWEYQVACKNSAGRDLTFVFSIRNNEYKLVRIQYFE